MRRFKGQSIAKMKIPMMLETVEVTDKNGIKHKETRLVTLDELRSNKTQVS